MKHLLKWVIPAGVLLLIGMWIGLNWENFPANEVAYVPVVKKASKDTTIINSETPELATPFNDDDEVISADTNTADMGEPAMDEPDATVSNSLSINSDEEFDDEPISSSPDEIATIIKPRSTSSDKKIAASKRLVITNNDATAERSSTTKRNVTPSGGKLSNSNEVTQTSSAKQTRKSEIVPESYMTKREIPVEQLVTVDGTYRPGASGKGVSEATFVVSNRSGKNLKRVNLEVHYLGKDNQLLKKREMPVTNIEADGSVNLKLPANVDAERLVYKVLYVSSEVGEFYYEPLASYASLIR